jgi:hypothetical protein
MVARTRLRRAQVLLHVFHFRTDRSYRISKLPAWRTQAPHPVSQLGQAIDLHLLMLSSAKGLMIVCH